MLLVELKYISPEGVHAIKNVQGVNVPPLRTKPSHHIDPIS